MGTNRQFMIIANNASQNLVDRPLDRANMLGNLSVESPTIEQMNAALTGGGEISTSKETPPEPAFGEHIREAVNVIRRIVR